MKKIMFLAATLGGGGAERVMLNLANQMAQSDNQVTLVVTSTREVQEYEVDDKIELIRLMPKNNNKLLKVAEKLKLLRNLYHSHKDYTVISFFPDINIYAIAARVGMKNKIILSERNDPAREPSQKLLRAFRRICYPLADKIVFQTKDAMAYFSKNVQLKGVIIPNPLNLSKFPIPDLNGEKQKRIVMFCRIKPQKNIEMMLRAIDRIRDRLNGVIVEIYGDGAKYMEGIIQKCSDIGLDGTVKFMGQTDRVYDILNSSLLYVSTSNYEGISNTMLEALAMGVPSIVTDCPIGGARMFIQHNENGILVPVNDDKELAQAILELLENDALRKKLATNAIKIRQILDLKIIAEEWLKYC